MLAPRLPGTLAPIRRNVFPLRLETPERFAALRDLLTPAQYEGTHTCRRRLLPGVMFPFASLSALLDVGRKTERTVSATLL